MAHRPNAVKSEPSPVFEGAFETSVFFSASDDLKLSGRRFRRQSALEAFALKFRKTDEIEVIRASNGAPSLGGLFEDWRISLSGRDGFAIAAISRRPIGVDIEPVLHMFELPIQVMHPCELAYLGTLSGEPLHIAFLTIWTLKEAYLKALGVGLALEPRDIGILFSQGNAVSVRDRNRPIAPSIAVTREYVCADRRFIWSCITL